MTVAAYPQVDFTACPTLDSALDSILDIFSASTGTVHTLGSEGMLHLAASQGILAPAQQKLRNIPVGKGAAGLAVSRRLPFVTERRPAVAHIIAAVPIFRGDAIVGALGIGCTEERRFSEWEMDELLETGRALAKHFDLVPNFSTALLSGK